MSKIAFLLLTYDEHNKYKNIENFLKNGNIYVHAKNPSNVKSYLKDYIIKEYVKTDWGKFGIVKAELKLLENAFKNKENKWFILMSNSCYPIVSYETLTKILNNNINSGLSFFNRFSDRDIEFTLENNNKIKLYKTSQFWILNRNDVKIILSNQNKYNNIFTKYNTKATADEYYFLTLLMNENKTYKYNDSSTTYVRWITYTNVTHPFVFNKLIQYDKLQLTTFNESKPIFFIRKISENFDFTNNIMNNIVYIIFLDKKLDNELTDFYMDINFDLIILYTDYGIENEKLLEKAYSILKIDYSFLFYSYGGRIEDIILDSFNLEYKNLLSNWTDVYYRKHMSS